MSPSPPRAARGVALVLVLWAIVLLSIIAGSFVYTVHDNTRLAANAVDSARAQALADAGIERAVFELLQPPTNTERWQADGHPHAFTLAGVTVRVTLRDEAGLIDVNSAPAPLLVGLFRSVGATPDAAATMAQAIVDWRTAPQALGGLPQGAQNAPTRGRFTTVDALQQLPGITPSLYRRIEPLVTVYCPQGQVDTAIAPAAVLRALPDVSAAQVQSYLAQRAQQWAAGQPVPPMPAPFGAGVPCGVIGVRAEAELPDGAGFTREAVLQPVVGGASPARYLAWRIGSAAAASAPGSSGT